MASRQPESRHDRSIDTGSRECLRAGDPPLILESELSPGLEVSEEEIEVVVRLLGDDLARFIGGS
jgi:hypothetical protein